MIHVYYHWWSDNDNPVYCNMRCPILCSIATLRGVNPTVPITVIEKNEKPEDWKHFPEKLNFSVMHDPHFYCQKYSHLIKGYKHLSRIFELVELTKDLDETVVYVDCDVFWFRDLLPLAFDSDKLCVNHNTGFFYYKSKTYEDWFEIFKSYTLAAIYSLDVRECLDSYWSYDGWYGVADEQPINYMLAKNPKVLEILKYFEHIYSCNLDMLDHKAKMLHMNGICVDNPIAKSEGEKMNSRGLSVLLVKEFYDNMLKCLDQSDLELMFDPSYLQKYLPMQSSIFDVLTVLLETKRNHVYWLTEAYNRINYKRHII